MKTLMGNQNGITKHHKSQVVGLHRGRRPRRCGSIAILVALSMVVLLGCAALAVDYGLLVNDKNRAQRAVDAASLAGAQELKETSNDTVDTQEAREAAILVAAQNGITVNSSDITFTENNTKIRVNASNQRAMYFARVLGIPVGSVRATAVAGVTMPQIAFPKPVPISITDTTVLTRRTSIDPDILSLSVVNPTPVVLDWARVQGQSYGLNEFLVFNLESGKSPTKMRDQLISGHPGVQIGDWVTSLNASDGPVDSNFSEAITDRFQRAAKAPWNDAWTGDVSTSVGIRYDEILTAKNRADNPRVMAFIVNKPHAQNSGTTDHQVLSFVPVYVVSWQNNVMTVQFLPDSLFGDGSGGGFGRTLRLLQ